MSFSKEAMNWSFTCLNLMFSSIRVASSSKGFSFCIGGGFRLDFKSKYGISWGLSAVPFR